MKRCYDCGSTVAKHHTKLCEMAEKNAIRDLPAVKGTQWWDRDAKQPSQKIAVAANKEKGAL